MFSTTFTVLIFTTLFPHLISPSPLLSLESRQAASEPVRLTLKASSPKAAFDHKPINANSQGFYIGRRTSSYCPTSVENLVCPPGNVTAIQVGSGGGASMDSEVPGGQPIYVPPTGNLSYTPGHLESIPDIYNYTVLGFAFTPYAANSTTDSAVGSFTFSGLGFKGWLACPLTTNITSGRRRYRIFANIEGGVADVPTGDPGDCMPTEIEGTVYTGNSPAWQYG
ncbi:MAG: hypothetical protein Q9163_003288 [Psora crenata]